MGLVVFSEFFASLFGVTQQVPFVEVGVFLLVFASLVLLTALPKTVSPRLVKVIVWIDGLWVVGSIVAMLLLLGIISGVGHLLIIGVAAWVAAMAILQHRGRKAQHPVANPA